MTLAVLPQPSSAISTVVSHDPAMQVRHSGRTTFLSSLLRLTHAVDPLAFLAAGSAYWDQSALFWQPYQRKALVGLGAAYVREANGPGRFRSLIAALADIAASLVRSDQGQFPILAGGAFHDHIDAKSAWLSFPAAVIIVPSVLLQIDENGAALRITIAIDEDTSSAAADEQLRLLLSRAEEWSHAQLSTSTPPALINRTGHADRAAWDDAITRAIQEIHQQKFDKVVLARQVRLEAAGSFSPIATLARLRDVNASATLFSFSRGDNCFLGASPERLVRLTDRTVEVSCLAGSIGLGNSDAERTQLAEQLLQSQKDRREHELVVNPIMRVLEEVCDDVERMAGTPRVVPARSVQHLETPLTAHLRDDGHVLDLVKRLHPTPAVGGFPQDAALQAIRKLERIERGWYAGPFGWTDLEGNGEFIVALRSASIVGSSATVFAGCGIVGDSIPAREYDESRLKMQPMLAALGAE